MFADTSSRASLLTPKQTPTKHKQAKNPMFRSNRASFLPSDPASSYHRDMAPTAQMSRLSTCLSNIIRTRRDMFLLEGFERIKFADLNEIARVNIYQLPQQASHCKGLMEIIKVTPRKPIDIPAKEQPSSGQLDRLCLRRASVEEQPELQLITGNSHSNFKELEAKLGQIWEEWLQMRSTLETLTVQLDRYHNRDPGIDFTIRSSFNSGRESPAKIVENLLGSIQSTHMDLKQLISYKTGHKTPTMPTLTTLPTYSLNGQDSQKCTRRFQIGGGLYALKHWLDVHRRTTAKEFLLQMLQRKYTHSPQQPQRHLDSTADHDAKVKIRSFGESRRTSDTRFGDPSLLSTTSFHEDRYLGPAMILQPFRNHRTLIQTIFRLVKERAHHGFTSIHSDAAVRSQITVRLLAKRKLSCDLMVSRLETKQLRSLWKLQRWALGQYASSNRSLTIKTILNKHCQLLQTMQVKQAWQVFKRFAAGIEHQRPLLRSQSSLGTPRLSVTTQPPVNEWEIRIVRKWACTSHLDRNIAFWRLRDS